VNFSQAEYDLRCEWGVEGLRALQPTSNAIVIVDVLSFSTAVDIALSKGASVLPYGWKDESATRFAAEHGAILGGGRKESARYTLSPASLRSIPAGTRLVLPSPNGSTLAFGATGVPTFTACLRNAQAVAKQAATLGARIAVIPAGERWHDGGLRPCLEDWICAGAVLAGLPGEPSPEAEMAIASFARFHQDLLETLSRCGSGRELVEAGFKIDVELAAEYAVSNVAPVLADGQFVDGSRR
jgi:2-phosphosulfolactate phosphatase